MPPAITDANTETVSSTSQIDDNEQESQATAPEDSSTSTDVEQSIADVVQETFQKHVESEESSTSKKDESTEKKDDAVDPKAEKPDAEVEKDKALPFHDHPRFKELVEQKNTFKTEAETYKQDLERLQPLATIAEDLGKYCQKFGISDGELQTALEIVALAKTNPKEFAQRLRTHLEQAEITIGDKLPTDLQKKVDDGLLDADSAKELSQLRLKAQGLETTTKTTAESLAQQKQRQLVDAANVWEAKKKESDLEYSKRFDLFQDRLQVLYAQQPPQTPAEVAALCDRAYEEVVKRLSAFVPRPKPRKVLDNHHSPRVNGSRNGELPKLENLDTDLLGVVRAVASRHAMSDS